MEAHVATGLLPTLRKVRDGWGALDLEVRTKTKRYCWVGHPPSARMPAKSPALLRDASSAEPPRHSVPLARLPRHLTPAAAW
jgi:hypothetical protein